MLRYFTDIRLSHPGLPLRQYLIYIGAAALTMPAGLHETDLDYRYGILDMHQVDCATLLAMDDPDALVLAVLCDFGDRDPQRVINQIFLRLRELVGDNSRRMREYLDMIEILSENRALKRYLKEAEQMLTQVDVTKLPSYELGMEKGMERGMEKGMERGMERGMEKGMEQTTERLARSLLGLLPDEVIAEKTGLSLEVLRRWHEEQS
jgi:hypothetical protein